MKLNQVPKGTPKFSHIIISIHSVFKLPRGTSPEKLGNHQGVVRICFRRAWGRACISGPQNRTLPRMPGLRVQGGSRESSARSGVRCPQWGPVPEALLDLAQPNPQRPARRPGPHQPGLRHWSPPPTAGVPAGREPPSLPRVTCF